MKRSLPNERRHEDSKRFLDEDLPPTLTSVNDESSVPSTSNAAFEDDENKEDCVLHNMDEKIIAPDLVSGRVYFTHVSVIPREFNYNAWTLSKLLARIKPQNSLHFNFMISVDWLWMQYPENLRNRPMTLVVGAKSGTDSQLLQKETAGFSNMKVLRANLPVPWGVHHTKMSIFESRNKLHVIISTANLIPSDWEFKTQSLYYASGDMNQTNSNLSPFANDLIDYISRYELPDLDYWIARIAAADFGHVTDKLIYSTPGYHTGNDMAKMGLVSLRQATSELPEPVDVNSQLYLAQCSSIGSLGTTPHTWLLTHFFHALRGGRPKGISRLFLIYPCLKDIKCAFNGYDSANSFPYTENVHKRQPWLRHILCKWRSEKNGRSKIMPHCKTYAEIVDGSPRWALYTSANLSKAAWGEVQKGGTQLAVRSYEMGVLITDTDRIVLPFDYPACKYSPTDTPFLFDVVSKSPDDWGNVHNPFAPKAK